MSAGKCAGCGGAFRSGTLVTLLDPEAGPPGRRARVCGRCAAAGHTVCAPRLAPVVKPVRAVDDELARAVSKLRVYAKAARAAAREERRDAQGWHIGRAEGFEGAIQLLEQIAAERL